MAIYDQVFARVNGNPLAENVSVDTSLESDNQRVLTILKGFAGISPSPYVRVISFSNVVPITGMEGEIERMALEYEEVTVTLQLGGSGLTVSSKGYFSNPKLSAGVGKTTTYDFEFVGSASEFA